MSSQKAKRLRIVNALFAGAAPRIIVTIFEGLYKHSLRQSVTNFYFSIAYSLLLLL